MTAPTLLLLRGLPASGKTTLARSWVAEQPNRLRSNRDDLRASLLDGEGVLSHEQEEQVTVAQQAMVEASLRAGVSVVIDDTNLRAKYARAWAELAVDCGARFELTDVDTDVEECVRRDAERAARGERSVSEDVIRMLDKRYRERPLIVPEVREENAPYIARAGLPRAILVDLDGTVALMGSRSPYDETCVMNDLPNTPVVDVLWKLGGYERGWSEPGDPVTIFVSGRSENCRADTEAWLRKHVLNGDGGPITLLMRPAGDMRKDAIVKREIFDAHLRGKYNIDIVLDDRRQVCRMWRSLGLTVLQVAEGNF